MLKGGMGRYEKTRGSMASVTAPNPNPIAFHN